MIKRILAFLLVFVSIAAIAQTRPGSVKGTVTDKGKGETIPFAIISIEQDGVVLYSGETDLDGNYNILSVTPGTYTVVCSFMGYATYKLEKVVVFADKPKVVNIAMSEESEILQEVVVVAQEALIETGKTSDVVTAEEIKNLPYRNIGQIVATSAGVYQADDGQAVNVRGARSSTNVVFIDGVKVRGNIELPRDAILQTEVITGGLPAQYGDVTGGVISTTTKGPTPRYFGSAELLSSSIFDKYDYNLGALTIGGPILKKKNSETGERTGRPIVGFLFAGEFQYDRDAFPRALPIYKVNDAKLAELQANPLTPSNIGLGTFNSADFLRESDLVTQTYRENAPRKQVRLNGNLKFQTSENTTLMVGGRYNYNNSINYSRGSSLMNYQNNSESINHDWTVLARFTQRFGGAKNDSTPSLISNAFYSIQVDYTRNQGRSWDARFEDDVFRYGHVGKFATTQRRFYVPGSDTITDPNSPFYGQILSGWTQAVWQDVGVEYTPGTSNPILANYTQDYYDFISNNLISNNALNLDNIRAGGGLLNGDGPRSVYGLWSNVGAIQSGYSKYQNSQFRVTANTTFSLKDHDLIVGIEYEQRIDRGYGVGAQGLWTLMRLLQNDAIRQLDRSNPIAVEDNGVFLDTLNYNRLFDAEKPRTFDKNVREKLGLDPNGTDWLDIDRLDPSFFSLDMFSANELLNIGSTQYVAYNGFDYTGNVLKSNPGLADFYSQDANGNSKRLVGAFQPIYLAGYIQDQFTFKDLYFNVGVRFDRFDANQPVLKDPYLLYPAFNVGDLGSTQLAGYEVPAGIGNDYIVYVDNLENPTKIVGYRDGRTWYDENGVVTANPNTIADASGGIKPFLKQPEVENQSLSVTYNESFVDYDPQWTVSPRISFQFPITDEAEFFAHYDLLVQRPDPGLNRFDPIAYLQLENGSGSFLNNPDLKPQKTTDYEIGFRQLIGSEGNSALKISAFYREMRDMMQTISLVQAYPITYTTYGNQDFGTVKGFTFSYDLRRTKNVRINANYTLQFADGSGSGPNSGANIARSGQPNLRYILPLDYDSRHQIVVSLDYRYGSGPSYNGPTWFNTNFLENFGVNFVVNGNSGTPYSRRSRAYALTAGPASVPLVGQVNGSRLPWQFRVDMTINKVWNYGYGEDKKKNGSFEVYLQLLNLFDTRNILGVYPYTGSPDDDGFLSSSLGQGAINSQTDAQSYVDLYNVAMANPGFYTLPRRLRLGIRIGF